MCERLHCCAAICRALQLVTTILNSTCVDLLESQDRSAGRRKELDLLALAFLARRNHMLPIAAGIALISSLDTVAYVIGLFVLLKRERMCQCSIS